jgi:hypothetical protein
VSFEQSDINNWKQIYIDHIRGIQSAPNYLVNGAGNPMLTLIYIDNDNVPEMFLNWGYTAGGSEVCTVYNDELVSVRTSVGGILYIERDNIFIDEGGSQGTYPTAIYSINDGVFEVLHSGRYQDPNYGSRVYTPGFDYFRDTDFQYFWDDEEISKDDYKKALDAAFDRTNAVLVNPVFGSHSGGIATYTPEEMIVLLTN